MRGPIRIGVAGAGLIAQRSHMPAYAASDAAEVVAVASPDLDEAARLAGQYGVPRTYASWQEIVADPGIEAVDICAPNILHAPITIAAARAGKHVLVEKPMATTLADADAMTAAAREAGVTLMVAHNLRFLAVFEQLKRVMDEGAVGEVYSVRSTFSHAGPDESWGATGDWFWREDGAGGGVLVDLGVHMIDILRWVLAREATEVTAMTSRRRKPTFADDNTMLIARFDGDILVSVQCAWTSRPQADRRIFIQGEQGQVELDLARRDPLVLHRLGAEREVIPIPRQSERGDPYGHFARAVRDGTPPLIPGEEGRATLAIAMAAYESARTRRTVPVTPPPASEASAV